MTTKEKVKCSRCSSITSFPSHKKEIVDEKAKENKLCGFWHALSYDLILCCFCFSSCPVYNPCNKEYD